MTATEPLVVARGLRKEFGRTVAVDDVDLDVRAGEVVGFLGPNGAGKTTVLRVLTGSLRATSGHVTVGSMDPFREAAAVHRHLGYIPGDLRLPGHLTGAQVLDLCAAARPQHAARRDELVAALAVPLALPVAAMSKGNRQKLGIVQALMSQLQVLLLDEPSSGLDPLAQEVLEERVRTAASQGAAVLLSSHVLSEVDRVADRVVMLRSGRVVASTRLDELRAAAPHFVELQTDDPGTAARLARVPGVSGVSPSGPRLTFTVPSERLGALLTALAAERVRDVSITPADLETLFLRYYEEAS